MNVLHLVFCANLPAGLSAANFVGDPGESVIFPPIPEVTLFGLTTRTIDGGAPPALLTGIPWPLLDNKMILFPDEAAATPDEARVVTPAADVAKALEVAEVTALVEAGPGARIYITRPA